MLLQYKCRTDKTYKIAEEGSHVSSSIYIRRVQRKLFEDETEDPSVQIRSNVPRDPSSVNEMKQNVQSLV